jgi:transposase InsO family protein
MSADAAPTAPIGRKREGKLGGGPGARHRAVLRRPEPWEFELLRLIAEQQAIPLDQLARFIGCEQAQAARVAKHLFKSSFADYGRILHGEPHWVWLSGRGVRLSGTGFQHRLPKVGAMALAFVIDAFSRKVIGWQLASHMRTDLVLDALRMALGQREPGADFALVAHTDRGSQYTSADYPQELDDHGVLASVGSVGDAFDNAMAESFVDTFKTELIADRSWGSRTQLELAVVEYIAWFNNDRLHESLGDVSPVELESLYVAQEV